MYRITKNLNSVARYLPNSQKGGKIIIQRKFYLQRKREGSRRGGDYTSSVLRGGTVTVLETCVGNKSALKAFMKNCRLETV